MEKLKQADAVLRYMEENGSISTFEAYEKLGVTRLPARISDIKKSGRVVGSQRVNGKNRYGENTRYAVYFKVGGKDVRCK